MKKKKLNILLILVMTFLWLLIVFRIISFSRVGSSGITSSATINKTNYSNSTDDTIVLLLNYREPFERSSAGRKKDNNMITTKISPIKKPSVVNPAWPSIEYIGTITNSRSNSVFAIVNINKKTEFLNQKDEIAGVKMISLNPDSLRIKLQNEVKTFNKGLR